MLVTAVQDHIKTMYLAGERSTIHLSGPPGIGKTNAIHNAAELISGALNEPVDCTIWQATTEDPLELPGLPAVIDGKAVRLPFEDRIPSKGRGLLGVDEINTAPGLTQASFYSLIHKGQLGSQKLGKDWMIITTGNRDNDGAVTNRMPTPLINRMGFINVEADLEGWIIHETLRGGNPVVTSFIKRFPHNLMTFDPIVPGPFASPRSVSLLSNVMNAYKKATPPREVVEGIVGVGPAREFLAHHLLSIDLIDPELIIKDPENAEVPKEPGKLYVLTTSLASKATAKNIGNIIKWLERIESPEYAAFCLKTVIILDQTRIAKMSEKEKEDYHPVTKNLDFFKWTVKNSDRFTMIKKVQ